MQVLEKSQSAASYCQARARDYIALTYEIAEASSTVHGKDLGYCAINGSTVSYNGKVHVFRGVNEAYAFILRMFW